MSAAHDSYNSSNFKPRVSPDEIALAKARPIAEVVGAVLELRRGFALCPFHGEKTPSFHVHRPTNTFCCFGCGARGDAIEFVRRYRGVDFGEAVRQLCGGFSVPGVPVSRSAPLKRALAPPAAPILALWNAATDPEIAKFYLASRNLAQKRLPDALRGHPAVWCSETQQRRPAVVAALTEPTGAITAVHWIWVETRLEYDGKTEYRKGARSLDLATGKQTWGRMGTGAVRLAAAGETVGISEGIESGLAAASLFKLPVWASCGVSRLGSIQLPEIVRHVVIFSDNGLSVEAEAAVAKAESVYRRRGYSAEVVLPEARYGDFADQVRR